MKIAAVVQARMGSTRLPGKVLRPVLGRPLLDYLIQRLRRASRVDEVVVATSTQTADDAIFDYCRQSATTCVRGDEQDVLARYHLAAHTLAADVVVRLTADCPLLDPVVLDRVIERFLVGDVDYVSNVLVRSYPRGLDTEVFSVAALDAAHVEARDPAEREHVTPFIWLRPDRFRLANVAHELDLSAHRWTVDTEEDFELIRRMLEALRDQGLDFDLADCIALLARNPDWRQLNAHVEQRPLQGGMAIIAGMKSS
jgi:spore coat polysaccharide biosynthesis protein SpsF